MMAGRTNPQGKSAGIPFLSGIIDFFRGVRAEYSKIIFPDRETLKKETISTVIVSVIIGVIIFLLDTAFKALLGQIL